MSVQSSTSSIQYVGNNSTVTAYPIPFHFALNTDIVCIVTDVDGVETQLALTTDFTLTGAGDASGNLVTTAAWDNTHTVDIYREVAATQTTSYAENDAFPAASHEAALDKLTYLYQQLKRRIDLGLRVPGETEFDAVPETPNTLLGLDANGNPILRTAAAIMQLVGLSSAAQLQISVKDFGAIGNGVADDTEAIQEALDEASGVCRVYMPAGTYKVSATIRVPSETYWFGDGKDTTTLKMASTVGRNTPVVQTGTRDDPRENIIIQDFAIDANALRHAVSGGTEVQPGVEDLDSAGTALNITYSTFVHVRRMSFLDGYKHCLDIQAPSYMGGTGGSVIYDDQPSQFVWIEDCYAEGGGDDNITTHHSSDIWLNRCISKNPSGARTPDNSNCYEIDDGSRNIFITDCVGIGGVCGLQIKGHNDKPAPYNIHVNGMRLVNNIYPVEIRHTGWYGGLVDAETAAETVDEDGNPIVYTGASPNARNVMLNNITVIAPLDTTALALGAQYAVRIRSYENVQINNLTISDGSLDLAADFGAYDGLEHCCLRIYSGARHIQINNLAIYGFADMRTDEGAVWITSSCDGPLSFTSYTHIDAPHRAFWATSGSGFVSLDHYHIESDIVASESSAVTMLGSGKRCGEGTVSGFERQSPVLAADNPLHEYRKHARSTGGASTTPQEFLSLCYEEGVRDMGAGEGINLGFKCRLTDNDAGPSYDGDDYPFANIQFRKADSNDGSAVHDFAIQLIAATDTTAPVDALILTNTSLTPGTDNAATLGSGSKRWSTVYAGTGSINTSDRDAKQDFAPISAQVLSAWGSLNFCSYRLKSAVAEKGDAARIHIGLVAQEIKEAFESVGLDPFRYGLLCYDEWPDQCEPILDAEGNPTGETVQIQSAGSRYGVRYEEALALECAYLRSQLPTT